MSTMCELASLQYGKGSELVWVESRPNGSIAHEDEGYLGMVR